MDVLDFAPGVSSDGGEIAFRLSERIGSAECAITREALEVHFWFVRFRLAAKRWRDDYLRMSKRGKLVPAVVVRNEQILADFNPFSKLVEAGTYHRMQFVEWLRERFKDMAPQS